MVTGETLDDQLFSQGVHFWISSVPPYYCSNAMGQVVQTI
jgi:hypothetical protein